MWPRARPTASRRCTSAAATGLSPPPPAAATASRVLRPGTPVAAASPRRRPTTSVSARCSSGGGETHGVRILKPETVELMTRNHLPNEMIPVLGLPGQGFGLGFAVSVGENPGTYWWSGVANTYFWIDPEERDHRVCVDPAAAVRHGSRRPPAEAHCIRGDCRWQLTPCPETIRHSKEN